jgi:hypothetical protein
LQQQKLIENLLPRSRKKIKCVEQVIAADFPRLILKSQHWSVASFAKSLQILCTHSSNRTRFELQTMFFFSAALSSVILATNREGKTIMVNQLPVSLLVHLNLSFTYCTMAEKIIIRKRRERKRNESLGAFRRNNQTISIHEQD